MWKNVWKKCVAGLTSITLLSSCAGLFGMPVFADDSFYDNLTDLSLCYAPETTSDNIGFSTKDFSAHGISDNNRAYKKSDAGELDTQTYLVYQTERAYTSFRVEAAYSMKGGKIAGDLQFEVSADGETYTPFTAVTRTDARADETWENDQWHLVTFESAEALPENTRYVRIAFGATAALGVSSSNTNLQICNVTLGVQEMEVDYRALLKEEIDRANAKLDAAQIGDAPGMYPQDAWDALQLAVDLAEGVWNDSEASDGMVNETLTMLREAIAVFNQAVVPEETFVDECDSASFPYRTSEDIQVATTGDTISDKNRYYKKLNHAGEWVEYKLDEGKRAKNVTVEAWYYKSNGALGEDCTIEYSTDGEVFSPATATRVADDVGWNNGEWRMVTFVVDELPTGIEHIRVTIGDTTPTGALYAVQIGRVVIGVAANYEKLLQNAVAEADELLNQVPAGDQPGMCPAEVRDELVNAKAEAEQALSQGAAEEELMSALQALTAAIRAVEDAIIYAVDWPDDAALTAVAASSSSVSLAWTAAVGSGDITYEIYQDSEVIGTTNKTAYDVTNLSPGIIYTFQVVAKLQTGRPVRWGRCRRRLRNQVNLRRPISAKLRRTPLTTRIIWRRSWGKMRPGECHITIIIYTKF